MRQFTKVEAARYLGISRTTLYSWLGGSVQNVFTQKELDRLAEAHGRPPPAQASVDALAAQVTTLQNAVDALTARMAAWEQDRQPRISWPPRSAVENARTATTRSDGPERPLPVPVRALVARWLAEHGGKENTIRRWPDLPLSPREALIFTQQKLQMLGYRAHGQTLHPCGQAGCVCWEVLGISQPVTISTAERLKG